MNTHAHVIAVMKTFNNLTIALKDKEPRNIWFNVLDLKPYLSIRERTAFTQESSHVQYVLNNGRVKLVEIVVYNGEIIKAHNVIAQNERSFRHIQLVLVHELLHIYLNHAQRGVDYMAKNTEVFSKISRQAFQSVWAYLAHVELTYFHKIIDPGVNNFFMRSPFSEIPNGQNLPHIMAEDNLKYVLEHYMEGDTFKTHMPTSIDDICLNEVSGDIFDTTEGIELVFPGSNSNSAKFTHKDMMETAGVFQTNAMRNAQKYINTVLDSMTEMAESEDTFWGYDNEFDIVNKPVNFLYEINSTPTGTIYLDVSGSMYAKMKNTNISRIDTALSLIRRLNGNFRLVTFNTDILDEYERVPKVLNITPNGGTSFESIKNKLRGNIVITDAEDVDMALINKASVVLVIGNPKVSGKRIFNIN